MNTETEIKAKANRYDRVIRIISVTKDPDLETYVIRFELVSIEEGVAPEHFFARAA